MTTKHQLRTELAQAAARAVAAGLAPGTSGNASVRLSGGLLVTPSGAALGKLEPHDLVELDAAGAVLAGRLRPSTEWRLHAGIYAARPEVAAIMHTHSPHATSLSTLRRGIPAYHYMVAMAGGSSIPCTAYETFGSAELAARVVAALRDRQATLLANHGVVAVGRDLSAALSLAIEVEALAAGYLRALAVGEPAILPDDEMARVLEQFRDYGRVVARR
ncbi:MAG: class II aldolase [Myxococcales bacterium]|nr:class II aldolase [Myxococcales bacterium]